MPVTEKVVRQTVTLPAKTARQVRDMARSRRLSASRMLAELVEDGIVARKRRDAGRFRSASDPKEVERLGEELGRMVFGE
jgi:hypothetical protein